MSLAELIKNIAPDRTVGLIIERHHRWDVMNMAEVATFFDVVRIYPRIFYSLRPSKIWKAIKTALAIRKSQIFADDILIGLTFTSFIENCFLSYFPKNYKINFFQESMFDFYNGPKEKYFFENRITRGGPIFFNKFLEPILGLNRTIYSEDLSRTANFGRYQKKMINDIYDQVYLY